MNKKLDTFARRELSEENGGMKTLLQWYVNVLD